MTGYKKIFLDTAPIIYFLEKSDLYYDKIRNVFQNFIDDDAELYTSAITYEEYEVGPFKKDDRSLIENFEHFIQDMEINVINIDPMIATRAAYSRAKYPGFKGMDSLQLATAISSSCELFFTNDKQDHSCLLYTSFQIRKLPYF